MITRDRQLLSTTARLSGAKQPLKGAVFFSFLFFIACGQTAKPVKPKKLYFYLTKRMQVSDSLRQYTKTDNIDTLLAESDSLALWQAVELFSAGKKVDRFLKKNGRTPLYTDTDFDVLDSSRKSIMGNFSREEMIKAETYIMDTE